MTEIQPEVGPVVKVSRDLSAIVELAKGLEDQAIHKANDRLMPGGLAMVALGAVASLDEWAEQYEAAEHHAYAAGLQPPELDDDDDWEPPLQSLLFWSESWRSEHGYPLPQRPSLKSESTFIRWALDWAWDNEPHFEDFARDINAARVRLENVLMAGVRAERGVPCMYEHCRGVRLVRKMIPARDPETGEKVWRQSDWHCPRCKRSWDEERYAAMVTAANERTKVETIADEIWCAIEYAARKVGRSAATIKTWAHRGDVATLCMVAGRRRPFVNLAEIEARDAEARRRSSRVA